MNNNMIYYMQISVYFCQCFPQILGGVYLPEQNGNGMESAVVAFLDCIHELACITFIIEAIAYLTPQHIIAI